MIWSNLKPYMLFVVSLTFLIKGCGIEVGNPTGETGNAGTISISIADAPIDGAKNFYIYIEKLELLKIDGEQVVVNMNESKKIDLLALQDGKKEALSSQGNIPHGDYIGLFVHLSRKQNSILVNQESKEIDVPFASEDARTIFMLQEFKVVKSKNTKLLIHVDLRQSVQEIADGSYIFNPTFDIFHEDIYGMIKGSITNATNTTICAYLYNHTSEIIDPTYYDEIIKEELKQEELEKHIDPLQDLRPEEEERLLSEQENLQPFDESEPPHNPIEDIPPHEETLKEQEYLGQHPKPNFPEEDIDLGTLEKLEHDQDSIYQAPGLPHFPDQQSVIKDETNDCKNAYASIISKDGRFTLRYLTQGSYDLRIFYPDGTYKDLEKSIEVGYKEKRVIEIAE